MAPGYINSFDLPAWGWIHLVIGLALVLIGICLLIGQGWATIAGIVVAGIAALAASLVAVRTALGDHRDRRRCAGHLGARLLATARKDSLTSAQDQDQEFWQHGAPGRAQPTSGRS